MRVAKLSDGRIVQFLKPSQAVSFSQRKHVLVADRLTNNPRRLEPYWVRDTAVVWILNFKDTTNETD